MAIPTSSSSSGYSNYIVFFNNINNGNIQDLQGIRQFCNGNDKELVQFVKKAVDETNDQPKYVDTLTKLIKITEPDTELHNKILTICNKNNIAAPLIEKEYQDLLHGTRDVSTESISHGILKVSITGMNEKIDRLLEIISSFDKEKRSKVNIHLDLSGDNNQISEKYGKHANSLTLEDDKIDDNSFNLLIKNFTNINELILRRTQITTLEGLQELSNLETLDCSNRKDLLTLPKLPNLKTLICFGCESLTTLPELPNLKTLDCRRCCDLAMLPVFPKLKWLDCSYCESLTTLQNLPKLKWLDCSNCANLKTLSDLPKLQTLDCSICKNLKTILNLLNLLTLNCSNCEGLTSLPDLPLLKKLFCVECKGLTTLPELPNLVTLDCSLCYYLTTLPMLPNLQTLACRQCVSINHWYLIIYLLKIKLNNTTNISKKISINYREGEYFKRLSGYFDDDKKVITTSRNGNDISITIGKLRQTAFNTYPILFNLIKDDFIDWASPIELSVLKLQNTIDKGGSLRKSLNDYYKNNVPVQNIPFSLNMAMPSLLIMLILNEVNVKNVLLPKAPQEFYFHPNPTDQQNNLFNEQQAFCDVICGCVRLAEDLGFKFNKHMPQIYPPFLINLIQTVLKHKKKSWMEISAKLPLVLKRSVVERSHVKDAVDDYINTIALASHIRNNPHFNTNTELEPFRLEMIKEFLKDVPIGSVIEFSDKWHSLGRLAQLNKAKTFANNSWEPLFTDSVSYDIEGRKIVALPLKTSAELTVEGDKLDHCVGGYTKKCLLENSHIISLRDMDGNPLSTLEFHLRNENGGKNAGHIINVDGETHYHLVLVQHHGERNLDPSHLCKEIEKRLLDDIRNGIVPVNLSFLDKQRQERDKMFKTPEKRNLVLVGYDPLDDDLFNKAIQIYRKVLSDMNLSAKKTFRNNFERLVGTQQSSSKPSSSNESFFV